MKTVSNTKEIQNLSFGVHVYYRMLRVINGMQYGYGVCVTETEMNEHRQLVARRLWDARRKFQFQIEEMEFERCGLT